MARASAHRFAQRRVRRGRSGWAEGRALADGQGFGASLRSASSPTRAIRLGRRPSLPRPSQ